MLSNDPITEGIMDGLTDNEIIDVMFNTAVVGQRSVTWMTSKSSASTSRRRSLRRLEGRDGCADQ